MSQAKATYAMGGLEELKALKELNEKTGPVFKMAEDPRITSAYVNSVMGPLFN